MGRTIEKLYQFSVDAEGQPVNRKFDLDKNTEAVLGLLMSSDNPALLFYRGTQRIELSGEELFPEGYESKLLMSGIAVAPDQRYKLLDDRGHGLSPGNGELKVQYIDVVNDSMPFVAYKVQVYVLLRMK